MKKYLLMLLAIVLFTGCLEITSTHYINPDKTGKVVMEQTTPVNPFGMGDALKDPEGTALKELKDLLLKKEDDFVTFGNISYDYSSDSSYITVRATGYYENYEKINKESMLPYSFYQKDGKNIFGIKRFLDSLDQEIEVPEEEESSMPDLTEEEIEQKAREMKRNAKMGIGMMKAFMSQMEISSKFVFGGEIKTIDGKSLKDPNSFEIEILGDAFQKEIDKLMEDDEYWKDLARTGKTFDMKDNPMENPASMSEVLRAFTSERGSDVDVSELIIDWEVPLFNYEEEVKKAKKEWEQWKKKFEEYEKKNKSKSLDSDRKM